MFKGTRTYYHLLKHLSEYNIPCYEQYGFHSQRSCESQLINAAHNFVSCLNDGGQCDVLFLDFRKAFDKAPHLQLFYKLHQYGIRGSLLLWIKGFPTNQVILIWTTKKAILQRFYQVFCRALLLFLLYCE